MLRLSNSTFTFLKRNSGHRMPLRMETLVGRQRLSMHQIVTQQTITFVKNMWREVPIAFWLFDTSSLDTKVIYDMFLQNHSFLAIKD